MKFQFVFEEVSLQPHDQLVKHDYYLSLVIPAKVQSYLMSGLPILGMVQGEAEQVIKKSGCGYTCESGNGIALASIVQKMILTSDADRISMGTMGRNFAIQEFDRKMLFKKLESWMFEYAQKTTYWRDTMQSESNSKYTGLEELLTAEKYRNKYNKYIVENPRDGNCWFNVFANHSQSTPSIARAEICS